MEGVRNMHEFQQQAVSKRSIDDTLFGCRLDRLGFSASPEA